MKGIECQKCGSGYLRLTWRTIVRRETDMAMGTNYRLSCVLCGWDTHRWEPSRRPVADPADRGLAFAGATLGGSARP